jgi:hypothetical protein
MSKEDVKVLTYRYIDEMGRISGYFKDEDECMDAAIRHCTLYRDAGTLEVVEVFADVMVTKPVDVVYRVSPKG